MSDHHLAAIVRLIDAALSAPCGEPDATPDGTPEPVADTPPGNGAENNIYPLPVKHSHHWSFYTNGGAA